MQKKHYEVVAAVITKNENGVEKIFCAQRPGPKPGKDLNETHYKWEFPGGKIEDGETREQALAREIWEEFGAKIQIGSFITTVNHEYKSFCITMHAFYCKLIEGELELKEHLDSCWLERSRMMTLDWAAADVPIVQAIM